MRIVSCYYTHKPGGFCKRLYRLLSELADQGHEVCYLTLDEPPEELSTKVKVSLLPFPLRARSGLLFWILFVCLGSFGVALKSHSLRPERYIAFSPFYSCFLIPARILRSAPLVLFVRALSFKTNRINGVSLLPRLVAEWIDRLGFKSASKVVCMTKAMQSDLESFLGRAIEDTGILPNETELRENDSALDKAVPPFLILSSGVIDSRKNLRFIVELAEELAKRDLVDIRFIVAGDGPLAADLKSRSRSLQLKNIEFLGWSESLDELHKKVHLVLHPSLHEGVSNSILEALSAGVPVLASDIPEQKEILVEQEALIDTGNVQLCADRIEELSQMGERYQELLKISARRCRELSFDWDSEACRLVLSKL